MCRKRCPDTTRIDGGSCLTGQSEGAFSTNGQISIQIPDELQPPVVLVSDCDAGATVGEYINAVFETGTPENDALGFLAQSMQAIVDLTDPTDNLELIDEYRFLFTTFECTYRTIGSDAYDAYNCLEEKFFNTVEAQKRYIEVISNFGAQPLTLSSEYDLESICNSNPTTP